MTLQPKYGSTVSKQDASTFTAAWHDLKAMARDLEAMPDEWARAIDAWQQPNNPGPIAQGRSIGSVSDTTGSAALGHLIAFQTAYETAQAVLLVRAEVLRIRRTLTSVTRKVDEHTLAQVKEHARCSGGEGKRGALTWGRPDCQELILYPELRLCGACYRRMYRWERSGAAEVVHADPTTRPKWDALMAASATNLRAGLEQIIEGTG